MISSLSSNVTSSVAALSLGKSSSSSSGSGSGSASSSSAFKSSATVPSSSPGISSSSSSFTQVTITTVISSGSSLYTTLLDSASQTEIEEIVQPTPFTTTIFSGSSSYTSSTILPDGQEEVEIIEPATTTTTSYTATTTVYTATNTGFNGQVTVLVVQPTSGMQYFGFEDPADAYRGTQPDASRFNNNASDINIQGAFPDEINFNTNSTGYYQFPGQTNQTDVATYAVVLEGYFYGPQGEYSVSLSDTGTDDYSFLWTGSNAYSAWTNANAAITESIAGQYTQNHTFNLTAESEFLPMTILWINVFSSGSLEFVIYPPAGEGIFVYPPTGGEITNTSGYFFQAYTGDSFVYHV